jgi:ABC-2 type transport system permease protein
MGIDLSEFEFPWFLTMMALIYFVLGYLFYAGMFASAGAMLGNDQDVQQVMLPVILPIVIPIMVLPAVVESPDATWAVILSLIPYFSPILMTVRIAVGHAATWQVVLSVVLLVVSVGIVARVAGRIYRLGILMKGKRPNLPELIRWVRYG